MQVSGGGPDLGGEVGVLPGEGGPAPGLLGLVGRAGPPHRGVEPLGEYGEEATSRANRLTPGGSTLRSRGSGMNRPRNRTVIAKAIAYHDKIATRLVTEAGGTWSHTG